MTNKRALRGPLIPPKVHIALQPPTFLSPEKGPVNLVPYFFIYCSCKITGKGPISREVYIRLFINQVEESVGVKF